MRAADFSEAVQKTWDSLPPEQREYWHYSDLASWDSYIPILEMLESYNEWNKESKIDTIIDVGCSWGTQSFRFHQLGYRYFGIDYNTSEHAFIGPDTDEVQFFDADATKMNFKKFNQKYNINPLSTLVICAYVPMLKHQTGYDCKRSNRGAKFMTKMLKYYSKYIIL
jgi:hypothetical protein